MWVAVDSSLKLLVFFQRFFPRSSCLFVRFQEFLLLLCNLFFSIHTLLYIRLWFYRYLNEFKKKIQKRQNKELKETFIDLNGIKQYNKFLTLFFLQACCFFVCIYVDIFQLLRWKQRNIEWDKTHPCYARLSS